jgi:hypothetical protein
MLTTSPPVRQASFYGTTSLAKGDRSRLTGWKPTRGLNDLLASVEEEVKTIFAEEFAKEGKL